MGFFDNFSFMYGREGKPDKKRKSNQNTTINLLLNTDTKFKDTKLGRDINNLLSFFKEKLSFFKPTLDLIRGKFNLLKDRVNSIEGRIFDGTINTEIIPPTYMTINRKPIPHEEPKRIRIKRITINKEGVLIEDPEREIKKRKKRKSLEESNLFFKLPEIERGFNLNYADSFKLLNLNKFINLGPLMISEINKNKI